MTEKGEQLALIPQCSTVGCENLPDFRFTWPGNKEQKGCESCAQRAQNVAKHMGFDLEVIRLEFPF